MQKRLTVFFQGTVQGVGFRFTAKQISRQHQVAGYVKNLADGRVEMVVEGEEKDLLGFLNSVRESSLRNYIHEVEIVWEPPRGNYQIFEIAH